MVAQIPILLWLVIGTALPTGSSNEVPDADGTKPPYQSPLVNEISDLIQDIRARIGHDEDVGCLKDIVYTAFTDTFLRELSLNLLREKDIQQRKIVERQIRSILKLVDDLLLINNTLNNVKEELEILYEEDLHQTLANFEDFRNKDNSSRSKAHFNKAAFAVVANDQLLWALDERADEIGEMIEKLRDTLRLIFRALNSEDAQTVEITLTSDQPEAFRQLKVNNDFNGFHPEISYGYILVLVSNNEQCFIYPLSSLSDAGYTLGGNNDDINNSEGSMNTIHDKPSDVCINHFNRNSYGPASFISKTPPIHLKTGVKYDRNTNKVSIKMIDLSTGGWRVDKIVLCVTVFRTSNDDITVPASTNDPGSTQTPRPP